MIHLRNFKKSIDIDILKAVYYHNHFNFKGWYFKVDTKQRRIFGNSTGITDGWFLLAVWDYENDARTFDYYWSGQVDARLAELDMSHIIVE